MTFKQFCILCLLTNYSFVTYWSFKYAFFAIEKQVKAVDTVMVLGAVQSLTVALLGYAFNILIKG